MKKCFKCEQTKALDDFYKHPSMPDGHVNKCKECNKKDSQKNRSSKVEYYRAYDRDRGNRQSNEYLAEYRSKFPKKYKAHCMVNNAIRDGRMKQETACSNCASEFSVHAHHDDYSFPLTVRWLCAACHSQWHTENGEGANAF